MTNVALLAPKFPPDIGGAAVYFEQVVGALQDTEYHPVVFAPGLDEIRMTESRDGYDLCRQFPQLGDRLWSGGRYVRRFDRLLRDYDIELAHVHPHFPQYRFFRWVLQWRDIPRIYDCRDQTFTRWYVLDGAQYLSATSDIDSIIIDDMGRPAECVIRCPVIVNPRITDRLENESEHHAAAMTDGGNKPLIAFVGDLVEHKGVHIAINAVRQLELKSDLDPQLHIAGAGELRPVVTRLAADRDQLTYHGCLDHTGAIDLLASADVVVMPSATEGRPRVALEAIAAATPVVATAAGDLPAVVGDAGAIVERRVDAVADGIRRVLSSPEYTERAQDRNVGKDLFHVKHAVVSAYDRVVSDGGFNA